LLAACAAPAPRTESAPQAGSWIRVNQLGYLPDGRKVAVVCSLQPATFGTFSILDERGRRVLGPLPAERAAPFAACVSVYRLDFSTLRAEGRYRIAVEGLTSPWVRVDRAAYSGAADTLLRYLRQQRSGYNPAFRDSVHTRDGILVDHATRSGEFIPASGGWHDAADYLQYGTTSAHATAMMLIAYRDHPQAFADGVNAEGLPGANGTPDILDEARHGLEWLLRLYPEDDLLLNQVGDDRDHRHWDLPTRDSSDYGWGAGGPRPVYPCTGKPQGLFTYQNRSTGMASTAGKYAAAFALGAMAFAERDQALARVLERKAAAAYALGRAHPGVCQTAPAVSPYFYEEDDWADDLELAAAELYALGGDERYLQEGQEYAESQPVKPWMGQDTAAHYQWFPWHNQGHYELWRRTAAEAARSQMAGYYRRGLEAVATRASNGFRVGVPFIWCSNNLMASFATQALLYRSMTGDTAYLELETAAVDWLFGVNPWGVSMVISLPAWGTTPRNPHSVVASKLGVRWLVGGLVDGPVYRSIFQDLRGIRLDEADEYAPFNTGFVVYHDDVGDYATNEPIMDGTANLTYLLAALAEAPRGGGAVRR
jgi:hypothetical protein